MRQIDSQGIIPILVSNLTLRQCWNYVEELVMLYEK
jgi:hypothetical protein